MIFEKIIKIESLSSIFETDQKNSESLSPIFEKDQKGWIALKKERFAQKKRIFSCVFDSLSYCLCQKIVDLRSSIFF